MELKNLIVQTLKKEVVPAMGCTEPVAVALACAKAKELIDSNEIKRIEILVSPNIYKNGLGVGIPNTEEIGLHIAAALGIICGKSEKELQVLEDVGEREILLAKELLNSGKLSLGIKDTDEKVYVEVSFFTDKGDTKTIIKRKHNQFTYIERNGEVLVDLKEDSVKTNDSTKLLYSLSVREIIKAIEEIPYEEISFMLDGLEMNKRIAKIGLNKKMGMGVGIGFYENIRKGMLADDLMSHAMMLTAAASDARMSGIGMSVMSSNGSGNNGLTAILPIASYADKFEVENERLAKAVAISHIINSYIKHYIGRLSALCGCGVAAGTGASAAIAWLMGANEEQIDGTIKNMIANVSGMICDGAKVGCALKLATSASTAIQSALLALSDNIVPAKNGIVAESAEETIRNLGTLSSKGMTITDNVILQVMKNMQSAV